MTFAKRLYGTNTMGKVSTNVLKANLSTERLVVVRNSVMFRFHVMESLAAVLSPPIS